MSEVVKWGQGEIEVLDTSELSGRAKLTLVSRAVHKAVPIIRVNSTGEYYYQPDGQTLYRPLTDQTLRGWVRSFWRAAFTDFSPRDITDAIEVIKMDTEEEVENLDNGCIMVSENIFWDKEQGRLVKEPTAPVFYRLFDTTYPTKHVVKVAPFTPEQEDALWQRYYSTIQELEAHKEIERYECLKVWADGSHDVYMDLHRAHAYMFLKKKPMGAYILIGLRRNGKSAFVGMTCTIMGGDNSSNVQLNQLGDPHYTHQLRHALVNAPDEEEDRAIAYQGFFKGLALDTPIPTPNGFTTMGELREGDLVFDKEFNAVKVLHKSEVHHNPCYEIIFSNYDRVVADHEHRWLVEVDGAECVKTTEELKALIESGHTAEITKPTLSDTLKEQSLPIDPYIMGAWAVCGDEDGRIKPIRDALFDELKERGMLIDGGNVVLPLKNTLEVLKIHSFRDIPSDYLYGSRGQRVSFLQGMLDAGGRNHRGKCLFRTNDKAFADFMVSVISAAGYVPHLTSELEQEKWDYTVYFYDDGFAGLIIGNHRKTKQYEAAKRIMVVNPIETVSTQCIEVDSPSHTYLFGLEHTVTHNTLADHGALSLPVMRSNVPARLNCDFMCFFPMNHLPEWTGTGASACLERSLVIPFNADLSKYDKTNSNFAEDTFTPDFMADYLGSVFAYAYYYSRHDLAYSVTMMSERGVIEEEMDNCLLYRYQFEQFFNSFSGFSLVYEDYVLWCRANELKIKTRKELKFVFRQYFSSRKTVNVNGLSVKVYSNSKLNGKIFCEWFNSMEVGSMNTNHDRNLSVVERLVSFYHDKGLDLTKRK